MEPDTKTDKNGRSKPLQVPPSSTFGDAPPGFSETSRRTGEGTYLSQLYSRPLVTTLTSFSHVANLVRGVHPYELINNVDEFVKQATSGTGAQSRTARTSENFIRTLNQNRQTPTPSSPIAQEMDTFVAGSPPENQSDIEPTHEGDISMEQLPIPAIPPIECSNKRGRLEPLTIEEYETKFRQTATDFELVERVFFGSVACNQLRAALWPYLFNLVPERGRFDRIESQEGLKAYLFVDHDANIKRWVELKELFTSYQDQWRNILPDQETRFSTFRERKSLIERDVIRCDRLHPFYAEEPQNLANLTCLLMTYMMYDFDIGYVQGMSDLAGPILYVYNGDTLKSFWVFVEVMKLFRRNFELTQKTIHFQLNCLFELVKFSDPIFAQYLDEHESSNCFFAFRAIVCQFKRELMKDDEDEYKNVLFLWDTTWFAKRRNDLLIQLKEHDQAAKSTTSSDAPQAESNSTSNSKSLYDDPFYMPFDPNQADTPRLQLTETEIFVLALCLSMIRRERDLIMAKKLDGTDIHLHFIDPKLSSDLNGFIEHAINIYSFLKNDFDITKLTSPSRAMPKPQEANIESPVGSAEGYDLLSDFLIINGASGT